MDLACIHSQPGGVLNFQKLSRSCSCSKHAAMRSVCDITLNPSLRKINVNTVLMFTVSYSVNSSCKLFLLMYTFIILTMR